ASRLELASCLRASSSLADGGVRLLMRPCHVPQVADLHRFHVGASAWRASSSASLWCASAPGEITHVEQRLALVADQVGHITETARGARHERRLLPLRQDFGKMALVIYDDLACPVRAPLRSSRP